MVSLTPFERLFVQIVPCDNHYAPAHAALDCAPIMIDAASSAESSCARAAGLQSTCVHRVQFIPDWRFRGPDGRSSVDNIACPEHQWKDLTDTVSLKRCEVTLQASAWIPPRRLHHATEWSHGGDHELRCFCFHHQPWPTYRTGPEVPPAAPSDCSRSQLARAAPRLSPSRQ